MLKEFENISSCFDGLIHLLISKEIQLKQSLRELNKPNLGKKEKESYLKFQTQTLDNYKKVFSNLESLLSNALYKKLQSAQDEITQFKKKLLKSITKRWKYTQLISFWIRKLKS